MAKEKNELIKLCDELEECRKKRSCYVNEIVCSRAKLTKYIDGDTDKALKLKAQIRQFDSPPSELDSFSLFVSIAALCLPFAGTLFSGSFGDAVLSVSPNNASYITFLLFYPCYGLFVLIAVGVNLVIQKCQYNKKKNKEKWVRSIDVVLEDFDIQKLQS